MSGGGSHGFSNLMKKVLNGAVCLGDRSGFMCLHTECYGYRLQFHNDLPALCCIRSCVSYAENALYNARRVYPP